MRLTVLYFVLHTCSALRNACFSSIRLVKSLSCRSISAPAAARGRSTTRKNNIWLSAASDSQTPLSFSYELSLGTAGKLTSDALDQWEVRLNAYAAKVRAATVKEEIMDAYKGMLSSISMKELDPLQITAFEVIANAAADTLLRSFPRDMPITSLIDELTDLHYGIITQVFGPKDSEAGEDEDL